MSHSTFHKIARQTTAETPPAPRAMCTTCESNPALIRVTAICFECRDQARMEQDYNWLVGVLILIAALGVVFEIGYNVGLRGSGL